MRCALPPLLVIRKGGEGANPRYGQIVGHAHVLPSNLIQETIVLEAVGMGTQTYHTGVRTGGSQPRRPG